MPVRLFILFCYKGGISLESNMQSQCLYTKNPADPSLQTTTNPVSEQEITCSDPAQARPDSQAEKPTCRICLTECSIVQDGQNSMISPCSCTGSMKYVHNSCLVEWLNCIIIKNLQEYGRNTSHIGCEVCKCRYSFTTKDTLHCSNKQQIKLRLSDNLTAFLTLCFVTSFCLCMVASVGVVSSLGLIRVDADDSGYTVFGIVCAFALLLVGMCVFKFLDLFVIRILRVIAQVREKPDQKLSVSYFNTSLNGLMNQVV